MSTAITVCPTCGMRPTGLERVRDCGTVIVGGMPRAEPIVDFLRLLPCEHQIDLKSAVTIDIPDGEVVDGNGNPIRGTYQITAAEQG